MSSKQYQILCQHTIEVHYEYLFLPRKVYQYAICTWKQEFCLRGILLSCQFFLPCRVYKGKCQQSPDHSDPQFSTADLCTNLTPEIGGWGGGTSFPSQQQRACLQTLLGRLLGGRVWKKGEGEFIRWLFGIALELFSLTNKTGLGETTSLYQGQDLGKGFLTSTTWLFASFCFILIPLVFKHMADDGCNSRNKNQFWVSELQWRKRSKGRD